MKLSLTTMVVSVVMALALLAVTSEGHRGPCRYRFRPPQRQSYSLSHYAVTTKAPTTVVPAAPPTPAPFNLQPLIDLLTQLGNLALMLFLNALGSLLPPAEVIVPPRLRRDTATLTNQTSSYCPPLPLKYDIWVEAFRTGVIKPGEPNSELKQNEVEGELENCQLIEMLRRLQNITGMAEVSDIVELFFLPPDKDSKAEGREIKILSSLLVSVSKNGKTTTTLRPLLTDRKRMKRAITYYYAPDLLTYQTLVAYKNAYPYLFENIVIVPPATPTTTTTTTTPKPPAPPAVDVRPILLSVLSSVLPLFGVELKPDVVYNQIYAALPLLTNFKNDYTTFVQNVPIQDPATTCQLLMKYYFSRNLPYGTRNTAAYAYNTLQCGTNPPLLNIVPTTTTKPTTTTRATTTTAKSCGVSTSLSKTLAVESSTLFKLSRIVGGVSASSCQNFPFVCQLVIDNSGLCGASIINATRIMTAAHCISPGVRTIKVTCGEYNTAISEGTEQVINVAATLGQNVVLHPSYYTTATGEEVNDIAIIKLPSALNFSNPCIQPVCLDPNYSLAGGKNCTVAGWGVTQAGSTSSLPNTLQMATVMTYNGTACGAAFQTASGYVTDPLKMLCAGYLSGGVDSCQGDSGGPLVCRNPATNTFVQVGIVSHGQSCALASRPGVYTNTAYFNNWIKQTIV